jgi:type I restriction enzyme S subunit
MQKLGDYIREVNVRNKDLKVTNLLGLSMSKQFRPSTSNIVGVDLSNYKVVRNNVFAFDPMSVIRVHKVPIALNDTDFPIIVSPAYITFECIDVEKLDPKYLMMWFQRTEFDRYADFKSDAAVRGGYDWKELCETLIIIPSIEQQREIVSEYETISKRIKLNEQIIKNLEATAQTLYHKMFVEGIDKENLPEGWRMGTLGEYATVKSGYAFPSQWWQNKGVSVIKIGSIRNNTIKEEDCDCIADDNFDLAKNYVANKGDIVIAMTGATLGKIALIPRNGFLINQRVGLFDLGSTPLCKAPYLYCILQQDDIINEIITVGGDSAQANISNLDIEKIKIAFAPINEIEKFNTMGEKVLNTIILKHNEINKLIELQSLLLAKMGK